MVRAILEGRKTQTRRVVKPQPLSWADRFEPGPFKSYGRVGDWVQMTRDENRQCGMARCPFGAPGDRLWVKETHARVHPGMLQSLDPDPESHEWTTVYRADANGGYVGKLMECTKWKPSIFMRREYSRITLEIEAVRVERLQEIRGEDALREGIERIEVGTRFECWKNYRFKTAHPKHGTEIKDEQHRISGYSSACASYTSLWESINGPGSWDANPWVWVLTFKRVQNPN